MQYLDRKMHRRTRYLELYMEISQELGIGVLIRGLRALNVDIEELQLESGNVPEEGVRSLIVTLKSKKRGDHVALLDKIRKIEGIVYMEEL
jgi:hypothetical protein